ncbi:Probable LRR receptor-like serine/threonine-protein kinase At3g47570 [Linum perenne]
MGSGNLWPFLAIAFHLCFSATEVAASGFTGNETDRLSLLHFKSMISADPLGALSSWNETTNFCKWHGVTCSTRHNRITVLDLRSLQLSGSVSPQIGNLSFLRELYLLNNSFTDEIPFQIGGLRRLERLVILNNSFSGEIPSSLFNCSNLVMFNAANNLLVGSIPWEIGSLMNLQNFVVSFNRLTGSIPASVGNLSSLMVLSASNNQLNGEIPSSIGKLKNLSILYLPMNRFSGVIPSSIFNLSSLTYVYFGFNQLIGSLPSELGISLPNLQSFDVALNFLTGNIPASLSNASNLEQLQLQGNGFTGRFPDMGSARNLLRLIINNNSLGSGAYDDLSFVSSLTNASSLQVLVIDQNNFGGSLPSHVSNLSALQILYISGNKLSGELPTEMQNLRNLQRLVAFDNGFSGTIPTSIGKLENLEELDLSNNSFTGNLPFSIGNLTRLLELKLARNYLHGEIPSTIADCKRLITVDLSHNNLSGAIPEQVMSLVSLSVFFNLSNNNLSGSLPIEVGNLKNLGALDLSRNMLSGIIPASLGSCVRLESVNLRGNRLQGAIPSSMSSLRGIQQLDISSNNLSGQIPKLFESMNFLQLLNLSYNDFEGEVPKGGIFTNGSIISVVANGKLCGGIADLNLPPCNFGDEKKKTLSHKWKKIVISTISSLFLLALIASCLVIFWIKKRGKEHTVSAGDHQLQMSYQRLYKATDGFSSSNLVGVGSFGSVYKGVLDENETAIAVKVFNLERRGASKSFMAECEALKNIRHRNLVRIVTVCSSVDYQGNDFKALIYEFFANGSLEEWLHPVQSVDGEPPKMLKFLQRLNAAIDIASAVDYLHHQCGTPIVHCDLKPSNVLLDEDTVAHVGDFGLARILVPPSSTADQISSTSIGMFTGKRPTDESFKEGFNLHSFVRRALSEHLVAEAVDPVLHNELIVLHKDSSSSSRSAEEITSKNKDGIPEEVVISILKIGVICSSDFSQDRISITEALARLVTLRKPLLV